MFHCADKVRQSAGSPVFGSERCREQQRTGKERHVSVTQAGTDDTQDWPQLELQLEARHGGTEPGRGKGPWRDPEHVQTVREAAACQRSIVSFF